MTITVSGSPPGGFVNEPYSYQLSAIGGQASYQWSHVDGVLPQGLTLNQASGVISGTPGQVGDYAFTIQVTATDGDWGHDKFSIRIGRELRISPAALPRALAGRRPYQFTFTVNGGTSPYRWSMAPGSRLPAGLHLDPYAGCISGTATASGITHFTVRVRDQGGGPGAQQADADRDIDVKAPFRLTRPFRGLRLSGDWLSLLFLALPTFGSIWIWIYAFATRGSHWSYVGVGMLTAFAAFMAGCLAGFLFGIPRAVSSGELRHQPGSPTYTPSSNLAEVSDWLTKLLLGAGLVELTRLGGPVSKLIDNVAASLQATAAGAAPGQEAKIMAGVILIGFTVIGLLGGYIATTLWYQKKIANL